MPKKAASTRASVAVGAAASAANQENASAAANTASATAAQNVKLQAILDEFDIEVESRISSMRAHADDLAHGLRIATQSELMKMPRNARSMTVREFLTTYEPSTSVLLPTSTTQLAPRTGATAANNANAATTTTGVTSATGSASVSIPLALNDLSMLATMNPDEALAQLQQLQERLHAVLAGKSAAASATAATATTLPTTTTTTATSTPSTSGVGGGSGASSTQADAVASGTSSAQTTTTTNTNKTTTAKPAASGAKGKRK